MTKSRKLTLFLAAFVFFAYGTIVGHYQVFPFQFLNQGVQYVKNTIRKSENFVQVSFVKSKLKNSSKFDWADQFLVERLQFSESGELNNFQVLRTSIENFGNEKLAYLNFSNGLLIAYAQNNFSLIRNANISRNEFEHGLSIAGGIKSLFYFEGNLIALVGLANEENKCVYASLVNVSLNKRVINFPCLPDYEGADLNGSGGGYIVLKDEGKILLALGTPGLGSAVISALAQNPNSPYGKILEISAKTIIGDSDNYKIFSLGHRNPQSMLELDGNILAVEHGPRGGDEINIIRKGMNYGWPLASLGSHYNLSYIKKNNHSSASNGAILEDPLYSFLPSIGISFIDKCPKSYSKYYEPNRCVLIGSMRAGTLFFVQFDDKFLRVIAIESYEVGSRLRKVIVEKDTLVLGTDFEGIIFLRLNILK